MQTLKLWIKKNFAGCVYRRKKNNARKKEIISWYQQLGRNPVPRLSEASFDNFTYHGEDGIIYYLLRQLNNVPPVFVDIGAGDCIKSNCANLAVHFGWEGIFIDKNEKQLSIGKKFYQQEIAQGIDIKFIPENITMENVNEIMAKAGVNKKVGLLSIDIDGNDYWIWKAIDIISPRVVVIEAKVEFGNYDLVVPYGSNNHHSVDKMYNGASVEAIKKLGKEKGYKLVGTNKQGYNLFFVRENEKLPEASTSDILNHPDIAKSFYPRSFFNEHIFVTL